MKPLEDFALGFALLPIAYLWLVSWPLARTDLREHRLPNKLTLPGLALAVVAQSTASFLVGFSNQLGALLAAGLVFALSLAAHVWFNLGMGDVKLLTAITLSLAWFSPWSPLLAVFVALAAAVVAVAVGFIAGRTKLDSTLPLGPYLLAGFAVSCVVLIYSPGEVIDSTSRALSSWASVSLTSST